MFNPFKKAPTPKEQQRECDRQLRKAGRDVERDRRELEREEKKLEMEIKKMAKEGNKEGCAILAKQLIQLRKQKTRTYAVNSKISGIAAQSKTMGANIKMADAMNTAAKTMGNMNAILKPEQTQATVREFGQQMMKLEMTDEMINDTLDDMLTESGDEDEEDRVVQQVLDEIGIETSAKMATAPRPEQGRVGEASKARGLTDDDIEAQLAKLRS